MKKIMILLLFATALCFAACSSSNTSSPTKEYEKIANEIVKGNYSVFIDSSVDFVSMSKEEKQQLLQTIEPKLKESMEAKNDGVKKIEVISEKLNSTADTAVLQVRYHYNDGTTSDTEETMVLYEGKWMMGGTK